MVMTMSDEQFIGKLEREIADLKRQLAEADLLLGDAWQEAVSMATGTAGIETALRSQCTKLSGDVAVLKRQLTASREREAKLLEALAKIKSLCDSLWDTHYTKIPVYFIRGVDAALRETSDESEEKDER